MKDTHNPGRLRKTRQMSTRGENIQTQKTTNALLLPVEFRFHRRQQHEVMSVSRFLGVTPASETSERPVYYRIKRVAFREKEYIALYYAVFYAANPGFHVCCCMGSGRTGGSRASGIGYHEADVERIVILLDEHTRWPRWVYYGAHGGGQGCWRRWEDAEKAHDGVLVVYVSYRSHGFYPSAGTYWRAFGLANDITGDGVRWRPRLDEDFQDAMAQTWTLSHFQVRRGINGPQNAVDPSATSITAWERFALALPMVRSRLAAAPKLEVLPHGTV